MKNSSPFMSIASLCMLVFLSMLSWTVHAQQFDVALTKTTITNAPVKYGTAVPFNLTIYNQGTDTIMNVELIDHLGDGFEFQAGLNPTWNEHPTIINAVNTIYTEKVPPNESRIITINLIVRQGDSGDDWTNTAEIVDFTDRFGMSQEAADLDSSGDENPDNDAGGLLGSDADDATNGSGTGGVNDGVAATDEDDHDRDTVQIFDLALTKVLDPLTGYKYGDTLTFTTTVYNQGNIRARLVRVRDIVPEGYINPVTENVALGWSSDAANPVYTFDAIEPFSQMSVELKLILDPTQVDGDAWVNYAEVIGARFDNNGSIGASIANNLDADSQMASNSDGERAVGQGDLEDNVVLNTPVISALNPEQDLDQDDHDPAEPEIFDLALIKERATALSSFNYGTPISYSYTILNQGNMTATDIVVSDSLPCGAMFDQSLNPDWSFNPTTRIATRTIAGPLEPLVSGSTAHRYIDTLVLTVIGCTEDQMTAWTNYMEISQASNINGVQTTEVDGVFDTNFKNDAGGIPLTDTDNAINGIGIIDEDNHDVELLQVYDLALKKETITQGPYVEGQDVDFRIRVYNQGNIVIEDFVPEGYGFNLADNIAFGWTNSYTTIVGGSPTTFPDTLNAMEDIFLATEDSLDITIRLQLELDGKDISDWYNFAHVWVATDTVGNNRFDDADSNPFTATAQEFAVVPGSAEDDNIFSQGKSVSPQVEEDDHDVANVDFFDLTLSKTATSAPSGYGQEVTFDIVVKNEGVQFAHDITVVDRLPCGLTFDPGNNTGWVVNAMTGNPEFFYTDTLFAGEEVTIPISLTVGECTISTTEDYRNVAEISDALNDDDITGSDQDSTPNNDDSNEDDQDDALVPVFDLSLEKIISSPPTSFVVGSPVVYDIIVTNEGNIGALNTVITDYVPCGLDFAAADNTGWTENAMGDLEFIITSLIDPGMSISVPLTLTIGSCTGEPLDLDNIVEITDDADPSDMDVDDFDSTPGNEDADEDDQDDAPLDFFDLSLEKLFVSTGSLSYGQNLDYQILVTNEGSIEATTFTVTDNLACGLGFMPNNGWTLDGVNGNITRTISTPLLPGESITLDLILMLEECPMPNADSWNNTAEISAATDPDGPADDFDSTPDNNDPDEDDQDDALIPVFDLSIEKNINTAPTSFAVGTPVVYDIIITNEGNTGALNTVITDYIPCGLNFAAADNTGWTENAMGNLEFTIISLIDPGMSVTVPLTLTIGTCTGEPLDLNNIIEITGDSDPDGMEVDDIDSTPDNNDPDEDDIDNAPLAFFDLSLEKTLTTDPASLAYGQNLDYQITVTNEGSIEATSFIVTDYLACGLGFTANNGWVLDPNTGYISREITTPLISGESVVLDLTVTLEECANPTSSSWVNIAEISEANDPDGPANDEDSTPDNNDPDEDDQDNAPLEVGDLSLSKSHADPVGVIGIGTSVDYSITVTNQGNVSMVDFVITDYIPCGLSFSPAGNTGWIAVGDNAEFTVTTPLAPGASITLPLTLTIQECISPDTPDYVNAAEVSDQGPNPDDPDSTPDDNPENDPPSEDDHDEDTIEWYDLSLVKSSNLVGSPSYGDIISYTITVTNEGSLTASGVEVTDYIPCGLIYDGAENTDWAYDSASNTVTNTNDITIIPGQSYSFTLNLTLEQCDGDLDNAYNNIAEISAGNDPSGNPGVDEDSTPDNNPNNDVPDEDDIDNDPLNIFDLSLNKSVVNLQTEYELGEDVTYNIAVTNEGNVDASGISITDYIPCGMSLSANNSIGWTVNNNGYAEYLIASTISPGDTENISIILTIEECTPTDDGQRGNVAEISGSPQDSDSTPDGNPDNDPDDEDDIDGVVIEVNLGSTIGDFVFNDLDGDGIQDNNEQGISGVIVILYDDENEIVAVTETGSNGLYQFEEIDEGNYYITFEVDGEFIPSPPNAGNETNDSNVTEDNGPGSTSIFEVVAGQDDYTVDAGFFICSEIKGVTYYDINEDDIRQSTENGINGLVVNLYRRINGQNILWASETTHHDYDTPSDDGIWDFCVAPGQYYIEVVMPPIGLVRVRPFIGGSNFDSDINGANGPNTTSLFTIAPGGSKTDLGAGYYPMATVGNVVWLDENFNGIQEQEEPKVAGVQVKLYNMDHVLVDEALTDEDGVYKIEYLQKEEYYLQFDAPDGLAFTYAHASDDASDSDVDHAMGINTTSPRLFNPGDKVVNVDAGLVSGVLPVTWKDVGVYFRENQHIVHWSTAQELNTDKYFIERRLETENTFKSIGEVKAAGNSFVTEKYQFVDRDVQTFGNYYYRINQIDLDGSSSYSDIVFITSSKSIDFEVYPNPTVNTVTIEGDFIDDYTYNIKVMNVIGKMSMEINVLPVDNEVKLDLSNLAEGIYFLEVFDEVGVKYTSKKIFKNQR